MSNSNEILTDLLNQLHTRKLNITAWGSGHVFMEYAELISKYCNILAVADINKEFSGTKIKNILCVTPDYIPPKTELIVVTIDSTEATIDICQFCEANSYVVCTYSELLDYIWPLYEAKEISEYGFRLTDANPFEKFEMKKYIGISIPENTCNLDCGYCYLNLIPYRRSVDIRRKNPHSAQYIRWKLRREVLGGSCLIGLTGSGETFYADKFKEVCLELLKEGHYLHIVTNGLLTSRIVNLLKCAGEYARHIIFKLSFHYGELLKKNLLDAFVNTVKEIEKSAASYTIELMPCDELVPYIDDILDFSMKNFGAYPQLTIGRDENNDSKLLSKMSLEEFQKKWSKFDSNMLDTRIKLYMIKGKNCSAGEKSFFINLYTGRISRCVFSEQIGNLYTDGVENTCFYPVENDCPFKYCFNCHIYATIGILPIEGIPTYKEIRDREKTDGTHWIKEDMRRYLDIKL